jgi:hypothetical protein
LQKQDPVRLKTLDLLLIPKIYDAPQPESSCSSYKAGQKKTHNQIRNWSIPKKAIHKNKCMETVETVSNVAVRTSNQQAFDKRLIAHIVGLVEEGVPRKVLVEQL